MACDQRHSWHRFPWANRSPTTNTHTGMPANDHVCKVHESPHRRARARQHVACGRRRRLPPTSGRVLDRPPALHTGRLAVRHHPARAPRPHPDQRRLREAGASSWVPISVPPSPRGRVHRSHAAAASLSPGTIQSGGSGKEKGRRNRPAQETNTPVSRAGRPTRDRRRAIILAPTEE